MYIYIKGMKKYLIENIRIFFIKSSYNPSNLSQIFFFIYFYNYCVILTSLPLPSFISFITTIKG